MKKLFALMLAALLILALVACGNGDAKETAPQDDDEKTAQKNTLTVASGEFVYDVNEDGDYEIVDYIPKSTAIVELLELPAQSDDKRDIVGIADNAFKAELSIKAVKIPDTYTYIGDYAFYDCDNLTTVTMGNTVTTVGEYAFATCDVLTAVTVSGAWSVIEEGTFKDCVALTSITLPESVTAIESMAFFGCKELTTIGLTDKLESVTKQAFYGCDKLAYKVEGNAKYLGTAENPYLVLVSAIDLNVDLCTVNAGTKIIANEAFANCEYLDTVALNGALKVISNACFTGCEALEYTEYENGYYLGNEENPYMVLCSLIIPSVEDFKLHADTVIITAEAFENCHNLEDISYGKTEEDWNKIIKTENWNHDLIIEVTYAAAQQPEA